MPARSRPNRARRPYLRSGFYRAKSAAAALMERALDAAVPDGELGPVEQNAREWVRDVVRHLGGPRRIGPITKDRIRFAGTVRIILNASKPDVEKLAVKGRLVNRKTPQMRPLSNQWPNLAKTFLDMAAPLDLPPELEGADLRSYLRDPSKPWNRRGRALDTGSEAPAASRPGDRSDGSINPQDAGPKPEEGGAAWSV